MKQGERRRPWPSRAAGRFDPESGVAAGAAFLLVLLVLGAIGTLALGAAVFGRTPGGALLAGVAKAGPLEPGAVGPSLWSDEGGNRYSNRKAMHVGDIITVMVTESSQGTNRSSLKTKKESKINAEGGPGAGTLGFLPAFSAKTGIKDELDGSGQTSLSGQLNTKISAEIIEIRPNGHLVIEGSRLISVNGDDDRITLHGVARPEDIRADNTIYSVYLAEARISYNGKGPVKGAAHRGLLLRIVSWFF
jgi:flagellar L-ring protein FlgH